MKKITTRVLAVVCGALVIVTGIDVATYAAKGKSLLIGRLNVESRTTTLLNGGATPALSLRTRAAVPPLHVTSARQVRNLNADLVDGKHATDLQTRPIVYTVPAGSTGKLISFALRGLPRGTYLVSYQVEAISQKQDTKLGCYVTAPTGEADLISISSDIEGYLAPTASGVFTKGTNEKGDLGFTCFSEDEVAIDALGGSLRSHVAFTRVDGVTRRNMAPAIDKVRQAPGFVPGR